MARGHSRSRSEVQGITIRSIDEEPKRVNVVDFLREEPNGSLKKIYESGDLVELYDAGEGVMMRIDEVKNKSLFGRTVGVEGEYKVTTRLVFERDSSGVVIGLKEAGATGRRAI